MRESRGEQREKKVGTLGVGGCEAEKSREERGGNFESGVLLFVL